MVQLTSSPTVITKSESPLSTLKEEQGEYVEFHVPSSPTAVAKSKLSFPTFKKEQDEAEIKVPPAPTITLSFEDPGSTSHPCMGNKFNNRGPGINCEVSEVIEVLPSKSNKKRK